MKSSHLSRTTSRTPAHTRHPGRNHTKIGDTVRICIQGKSNPLARLFRRHSRLSNETYVVRDVSEHLGIQIHITGWRDCWCQSWVRIHGRIAP